MACLSLPKERSNRNDSSGFEECETNSLNTHRKACFLLKNIIKNYDKAHQSEKLNNRCFQNIVPCLKHQFMNASISL